MLRCRYVSNLCAYTLMQLHFSLDIPTGCDTPDASNAAAGKCTSAGCSDGYYYDGAGDCGMVMCLMYTFMLDRL